MLLTGFLGAGKTTFLNRVLADGSSGHVAVIVNEFGEAGLDHELIEAVEDEVVLMQSGCLCCSIRGDLSRTIADLLARRERGQIRFDRAIIETTGMADPGPILQTFLLDPVLASSTRLDGVVTVVDAVNGAATLVAQFEAVSQVAMADLILLGKTDLVTAATTDSLAVRLRDLNPTAPIIQQYEEPLAPDRLWGLSGLRQDATKHEAIAWNHAYNVPSRCPYLSGLAFQTSPIHILP
ncbi:UNVERIFIED_CONTAM: hypothetical protein GTU68_045154 [Idotea baltica]|nr:hypothetical protein [Idotea baltica]